MKTVVVTGAAEGQGASAVMVAGKWCGVVLLKPWQGPDGKVHGDLLHVTLPPVASSAAAMKASARVQVMANLRMEVQLRPKRPNRLPSARVVGSITRVRASSELAAADVELSKVVAVRDPRLGRMKRAPKQTCFEGRMRLLSRPVSVVVWQKTKASAEKTERTVVRASQLIGQLERTLAKVPAQVAKKMLKLAIDWQQGDGPDITPVKLQRQLRLTEISVPETGTRLDLDFDCGDVFADHGVKASVTASGRVMAADIA